MMICRYVSDSGWSRYVNTTGDMLDERMSTVDYAVMRLDRRTYRICD